MFPLQINQKHKNILKFTDVLHNIAKGENNRTPGDSVMSTVPHNYHLYRMLPNYTQPLC